MLQLSAQEELTLAHTNVVSPIFIAQIPVSEYEHFWRFRLWCDPLLVPDQLGAAIVWLYEHTRAR